MFRARSGRSKSEALLIMSAAFTSSLPRAEVGAPASLSAAGACDCYDGRCSASSSLLDARKINLLFNSVAEVLQPVGFR